MGKQGSVNFGYDSVTPEVREWYYDLFGYLLGKLDSNHILDGASGELLWLLLHNR